MLSAFVIALLVIAAGMKLLITVQKETLGGFYKYTTWFVIIMGFFMLVLIFCMGMGKFYYHAKGSKYGPTYKMMGYHGRYGKDGKKAYMHKYHGGKMSGCDEEEMRDCCPGYKGGYDASSDKEASFWKKKWEECHKEAMKDSILKRNR